MKAILSILALTTLTARAGPLTFFWQDDNVAGLVTEWHIYSSANAAVPMNATSKTNSASYMFWTLFAVVPLGIPVSTNNGYLWTTNVSSSPQFFAIKASDGGQESPFSAVGYLLNPSSVFRVSR